MLEVLKKILAHGKTWMTSVMRCRRQVNPLSAVDVSTEGRQTLTLTLTLTHCCHRAVLHATGIHQKKIFFIGSSKDDIYW
jgi:hypothetical protein